MKANCCYRLIPFGEVIHSKWDIFTKEVEGLPKEFMDTQLLNLEPYSPQCYLKDPEDADYASMCESILLANNDIAIVFEYGTIGYETLRWDGGWRFMRNAVDEKNDILDSYIPGTSHFKQIGFRPTKLIQYRACPTIFRMAMSVDGKYIYTNDGRLEVTFDTTKLEDIAHNFAGYKEAVEKGYYGVVYMDGGPRFINKTSDNKIILL